ncbi:FAD:protein FMN transferase [Microbacterium sp.]|uniref:FAD:protein FMN transferase n=1 Tax=Microbacterium sp. TaxID=51671 RepID=UPI0025CF8FDC|nr:FAD:protein FMN transferase [Microbacterium sp.]
MTGPRVFVEPIMGTVASIHVIGDEASSARVDAGVRAAIAGLQRHERVFSMYRDDSDIQRLRRGEDVIENLDGSVAVVAERCRAAREATGGLFDAELHGWFDPTGYVKGWAVDDVAERHLAPLVRMPGVTAIGINVGGDMRLFSDPDSDWVWRVGIADPSEAGRVLGAVTLDSGAVATSGSAERGRHILDPRTGEPAAGVLSATIVADDLTTADLWATAAVVAGIDGLARVRRAPVRSGLVVGAGGEISRWLEGVAVSIELVTPTAA